MEAASDSLPPWVAHVAGRRFTMRTPWSAWTQPTSIRSKRLLGAQRDGHFPSMILQHSTKLQRHYTELTQHLSTPRLSACFYGIELLGTKCASTVYGQSRFTSPSDTMRNAESA